MGLKRTVTDLESVPENARGMYVPDGDNFKLADEYMPEGFVPVEDVAGLKTKNAELLGKMSKLKGTYEGVDLDEYRKFIADKEQADREKQKLTGDFDARERMLVEQHQKELAKLSEQNGTLNQSLQGLMVDNAAQSALVAARAKKVGGMGLLMPHIRQRTQVVEEDGRHTVKVFDDNGQVRLSTASGSAQPMSIAELVAEMRESEEYGVCFEAENKQGTGNDPNNPGAGKKIYSRDELRTQEGYAQANKEYPDGNIPVRD